MERIQTIVWDWNGTLLDDVALCRKSINRLLASQRLPLLDLEQYRRVFQFPIIEYYRKAGFDFAKESFASLAHRYMAYYQPRSTSCPLQEHADQALAYFQQKGLRQVLLSASKIENLKQQLAHYPIADYFDAVLGIGDVYAHSKAELACRFVKESGETGDAIVFIGDSVHDYEVAQAAGCRCVLVAAGHEHKEKLLRCDCETVDSLAQLITLF